MFCPSIADGHGLGISLEQISGEYLIDVDADVTKFISDEPINFSFIFWNKERTEKRDVDNVWVSIAPAGIFKNIFGALLAEPDVGGFRLTTIFPKAGKYTMVIRLGKEGKQFDEEIAEATFEIDVENNPNEEIAQPKKQNYILIFVSGLIIGALAGFYIKK